MSIDARPPCGGEDRVVSSDDASVTVGGRRSHLQGLGDAARAIAGAATVDDLLQAITNAAMTVIGTHQAVTSRLVHGWTEASTFVALSDKYESFRDYDVVPQGLGVLNAVTRENQSLRLNRSELAAHPEWRGLRDAPGHPPLPDYLAAPLVSRDGRNIGLIQLSDKVDGSEFTAADEAALVQLAQMASAAVEHVELAARLEQALSRLSMALASTRAGTWDWDAATGRVTWSPTLERIFGYEPGAFPGEFDAYIAAIYPEDREAAVAAIAAAREARGTFDYEHRIVRTDGEVRWIEGSGMAITDVDGNYGGMTGMCVDVTVRRIAEEQTARRHRLVETLHRVGQAITSRLQLDEIVQLVTDEATDLTPAAFGAFFYNHIDANGESFLLYTISGVDRARFEQFPHPRATAMFAPTFNGEATVLIDDVTVDPRFGRNDPYFGLPPGHLPVRSYLATPVVLASGDVAGGLFFAHPEPGQFTADDAWLVEGIASYAAIAIDNARLYERSRRISNVLQESLLPPSLPDIEGVDVAARYDAGATSVGGDFYDLFPLADGRWGFLIGDMCGQGPEAASRTAVARHTVRTAAVLETDDLAVMEVLNRALLARDEPDRFCTALYGTLTTDGGRVHVEIANAGHPEPVVRRADGAVEPVDAAGGTLLGVIADATFRRVEITLEPGDSLVLFTDGVIEARDGSGEQFGYARLHSAVRTEGAAEAIARAVEDGVLSHRHAAHADDLAVLVLQAHGDDRARIDGASASARQGR